MPDEPTAPTGLVDDSQRRAARVVGGCYLLALVAANFSEIYVRGRLVSEHAAETARTIAAHEQLFRLGIAGDLTFLAIDLALITGLYVVLERVSRPWALFAAFARLVETGVGVAATLNNFDVLKILHDAGSPALGGASLLALDLRIDAYGSAMNVCFVFFGIGSSAFGYLWLRSSYIPKWLAALGLFGSLLFAAGSFGFIVAPHLTRLLAPAYFIPIFLFELTMGFWLLIRGLRR